MSVAALVLAAGRGERLGHALPKGFVPVAGRPLLVHAIEVLHRVAALERIVPVIPASERARYDALAGALAGFAKLAAPAIGGRERQDSVRAGLEALPGDAELVAVHDAARPLVRAEDVARVVAVARREGAAILAVPVSDTIKRVRDGRVVETPDRGECWAAQTPQVFLVQILREALAKAEADGFVGSDDAQLVERLGLPVRVVPGDPGNLKLTRPEDLAEVARRLARGAA